MNDQTDNTPAAPTSVAPDGVEEIPMTIVDPSRGDTGGGCGCGGCGCGSDDAAEEVAPREEGPTAADATVNEALAGDEPDGCCGGGEQEPASESGCCGGAEETEAPAAEGGCCGGATTEAPASEPSLEERLAERTEDLQRLQAEYVNYKRRVDRDRDLARQGGISAVATDLLPIMDSIDAARSHNELTGGFKLVADELGKLAGKYGLVSYGEAGDEFDPQLHDALMQAPEPNDRDVPVCAQILQPGWKLNDRILRHAKVAVADPS